MSSKVKEQDAIIDTNSYPDEYDPPIIKKEDIAPLLNKNEDVFISYDPKATLYDLLNDRDKYILPKLKKEPTLTEKQDFLKAIMPCTGVVAPIIYTEITDNQIHYVVADKTPQLNTILEYLDNKIPVNNKYFKDLDQDVQDVFLGSTYLEEKCYIYKHKGKIKNFPKKLKKEIFENLTNS